MIDHIFSTLLHSKRPKLHTILVFLSAIGLRCRSTSSCLSAIFTMGNTFHDFLFACLNDKALTKCPPIGQNVLLGSKFCPHRADPF